MKYIAWNQAKNDRTQVKRGISFEEVLDAMLGDGLIRTERHPNWKKYPTQHIYIVEIRKYAYLVPFVEDKEKFFLKTIIPSRKATKRYIKAKKGDI